MANTIIIVGGGPVGLWTAIQIKTQYPEAHILIFERYAEYKRTQTLQLDLKVIKNKEVRKRLEALGKVGLAKKSDHNLLIPIQQLENVLQQYAKELGIEAQNKTIDDFDQLLRDNPEVKVFIAADGARSNFRKWIHHKKTGEAISETEDKSIENKVLQYLVELKYQVTGEVKNLSVTQKYSTEKEAHYSAFETCRYDRETNTTQVAVRFMVDKNVYEKFTQEASFKNPLMLEKNQDIPAEIKTAINRWLNARSLEQEELYQEGSFRLNKIILSKYHAKYYYHVYGVQNIFLVGDAACGVPYLRALKSGIRCGTFLSSCIAEYLKGKQAAIDISSALTIKKYIDYISNYFTRHEGPIASAKDTVLNFKKWFTDVSSKVPWQVCKFDATEKTSLAAPNEIFRNEDRDELVARQFFADLTQYMQLQIAKEQKRQTQTHPLTVKFSAVFSRDKAPSSWKDEECICGKLLRIINGQTDTQLTQREFEIINQSGLRDIVQKYQTLKILPREFQATMTLNK